MTKVSTADAPTLESVLSSERKRLIHQYMPEPGPEELEEAPPALVEVAPAPAGAVATLPVAAPPAVEVGGSGSGPGLVLVPEPRPAGEPRPRRRRGRPPGRRQRRQVHFHVDPDEDRLLLAAARRFGSQQKGLIAALHALQEVVQLRERVMQLEQQYERQRTLLAEAEALFRGR